MVEPYGDGRAHGGEKRDDVIGKSKELFPVAFGLMHVLYMLYVKSAVVATVYEDLAEVTAMKAMTRMAIAPPQA